MIGAAVAPLRLKPLVTPPLLETHVAASLVIGLPLSALLANDTVKEPVAVVVEPDLATTFVGGAGDPMITRDELPEGPEPRVFVAFTEQT